MNTGTVVTFDVDQGLGTIELAGGDAVGFHCVAIADGTRRIEVGTPVVVQLGVHLGRRQAVRVQPR